VAVEFERNSERYEFLRWGQQALANFRVVPPNTGIVHQVNLEFLAKVVFQGKDHAGPVAYPDTLVGTDSHTTMINGLGVLGWGVGGIEAEANMLGQPLYMLTPEVVGMKLTGRLAPGATATDLVLRVTEILRKEGVVNKFVEFFGDGVSCMSLADRATIANMAPEYGATMGFFPVDQETLKYLQRTGRTKDEIDLVERYCKEQGIFRLDNGPELQYTKVLHLDLSGVEPAVAGPKRPQDRVLLSHVKKSFHHGLTAPIAERGFGLTKEQLGATAQVHDDKTPSKIAHGSVVIAAITSCTNTSNPSVMIGAGLLAKKAVARGLKVKPFVKTSLAPGSRVVTDYLTQAGVLDDLEKLGFNVVGYGCTTCIGNSGPLPEPVANAITEGNLVAAAVLSGNRNFEGRVNPHTRANYLASPPLVVAYALAGTVDIDFDTTPIGEDKAGKPVYFREIWPTAQEVHKAVEESVLPEMFLKQYSGAFTSNEAWNAIPITPGDQYAWDSKSTYIQRPPFLEGITRTVGTIEPIHGAKALAILGDSVTTDHISPAGSIAKSGPAGKFLVENGVQPADFNSYGARRGNDRVMVRGTFANIRIRNAMVPGVEGGVTKYLPTGETMSIYDASIKYQATKTPLVVLAGAEYGTGSSRDWAAKGTLLLGIKAVIAVSYERIHRSNLVGMGVLPLQFLPGETVATLGLTGEETFDIPGLGESLSPRSQIEVVATKPDGTKKHFHAVVRIDTPVEIDYYRNGGILPTVLRKLAE
jgi:aconitate hydratase